MSCNYAEGLSPYYNKGKLGLKEKFDSKEDVGSKVVQLAEWISSAKHTVIHTGAGISTSAGIPDFRGPNGVWTLEERGLKPEINISFDEAVPTKTHMSIVKLVESGKVQYVVSQNIDGLHLRSGLPRSHMAELHGNMFTERCNQCGHQFVRKQATTTVGQKSLETPCPASRRNGRPCRGRLHDTILDWEHNLPENDLGMSDFHSCIADLSICLGTTLQIVPSGNLPLYTKKFGGRLVICNLQPTKHDRKADLIIHSYVDDIMVQLMKLLDIPIPEYSSEKDPTKLILCGIEPSIDWTIPDSSVKIMRTLYEGKCCKQSKKRGLKTGIERKDVGFKQIKRSKPKEEEEKYENTVCASQTDDISDNIKTEMVSNSLESENNIIKTVNDSRENVTKRTDYDIKTENDDGHSQIILEDPQNILPNEHLHGNVVQSLFMHGTAGTIINRWMRSRKMQNMTVTSDYFSSPSAVSAPGSEGVICHPKSERSIIQGSVQISENVISCIEQKQANKSSAKKRLKLCNTLNAEGILLSSCNGNRTPIYGLKRFKDSFYDVTCEELAKVLLGKILVRRLNDGTVLKGRIVETECYLGGEDKASHSYNGRITERSKPMYMKPGTSYVYMTYGMYHCFNISSQGPGAAVLLRALEPLEGLELMQLERGKWRKSTSSATKELRAHDLCSGPAKLCISFNITKMSCNEQDLTAWDGLWIEEDELNQKLLDSHCVVASHRIGIDSVGSEWASKPLRFYLLGNLSVSRRDKTKEKELRK